ncbi:MULTISPECIES: peptide deformylase [unclassified Bifidobacterium]|uniref:peptide deformylase n=1 Tax=Bifidobacterium sp. ESL0764 TaxID=2983228 RepID=UPI0023F9C4C9|nr:MULTISPECIES: peptide deformylase [unclassified Bifidobacterium]WEV66137.1 peptide deformylase [Bifidobacterium sp. ESL0764]WEV75074.1 peptide deformylase [Bifidobacterium sp. ESL0800]
MFSRNSKVDTELNRAVEHLIKTGGKEKILPIVQMGEPVLRQNAVEYDGQLSKRTLSKLIEAMRVTMLEAPGVGLAAPQIGLGLRIAVVEDHVRVGGRGVDDNPEGHVGGNNGQDTPDVENSVTDDDNENVIDDTNDPREIAEFPFRAIINPTYEPIGSEQRSFYEGCLSFSGYQAVRRRWLDIVARWQDEDGNKHEERLHGWPARIFQHETDHLSGEVYIDQAEIRSLATDENLEDYWCEDPVPADAAKELGFKLA